jgi:ATP-dependent DNA helicase RecQ
MDSVIHTKIQEPRVAPNEIYIQLTHKDIWLDFFSDKQTLVSALMSGDTLDVNAQGCATANGQTLLKFSQQFVVQLARLGARQYNIAGAKVNFVVYWLKEGAKDEIQIVLPELYLKKG